MSGHVEAFSECFVSLSVGSTKGPFAYPNHTLGRFMAALEAALTNVEFRDPVLRRERHTVRAAKVFHVAPNIDYLRRQLVNAAQGGYGDIAPAAIRRSDRAKKAAPKRSRAKRR